jgi:NADPH:quinone reductase-like Zn-dependent oxidoreductase
VPLAAGTAWEVLQRLRPPPGAWLLVHGASGGVGTFLVQLATAAGVRVIAVGGAGSHRLLGELDAAADLVGGAALQASLAAVRAGGQLVTIATPRLDLDAVLDANLTFHGVLIQDNGEAPDYWPTCSAGGRSGRSSRRSIR